MIDIFRSVGPLSLWKLPVRWSHILNRSEFQNTHELLNYMFLIWNLPPRCTAQCQGQWPRKTWLWRTGRLWSTRTLKMKDGFSSGCWEIDIGTRWYGRHRLWARLWLSWFIPRLDLSAAGEVSELMNTGAYETYLKEECEDHWVKHIHLPHMRQISLIEIYFHLIHLVISTIYIQMNGVPLFQGFFHRPSKTTKISIISHQGIFWM